jgi:cytochrome c-type biogenesis protein
MNQATVLVAFLAGFFSFLNPCVLPLVPGFLGYLSGVSLAGGQSGRPKVFLHSLFFVLGFSCVFALAGVLLNTVLLNVSYAVRGWLGRIGGTLIILFGLHLLGLLKFKFLETERKIPLERGLLPSYFFSFVFGAVFGVSWTPCVGAILGSVLVLAVSQPGASFALLVSYALGIGLPFLFVGAFSSAAVRAIRRATGFLKYFNAVIGIFLLVLGVLVFTGNLSLLVTQNFFNKALLK